MMPPVAHESRSLPVTICSEERLSQWNAAGQGGLNAVTCYAQMARCLPYLLEKMLWSLTLGCIVQGRLGRMTTLYAQGAPRAIRYDIYEDILWNSGNAYDTSKDDRRTLTSVTCR